MKPGDFGLTTLAGWSGLGIKLGEWANGDGFRNYQHAFMVLDDAGRILEAAPGGAHYGTVSEYAAETVVYSSWDLTDDQRGALIVAATKYLDTPYSALDYFALVAHRLHIPAPGLKSYVADSGHMICSQLVDQVYQDAGLQLFADHRWPGYVTPASLERALTGPVTP